MTARGRAASSPRRAVVNGEPRLVEPGTRLDQLVEPGWGGGVAIARNGTVVPRAEWPQVEVQPGDEIEIVHPIQGG